MIVTTCTRIVREFDGRTILFEFDSRYVKRVYDDLTHTLLLKTETTITRATCVRIQLFRCQNVRMYMYYEFKLKYVSFRSWLWTNLGF